MQLLVQSLSLLKILKNVKKIEKIHTDSEKLRNSFEIKKERSPDSL